MKNFTFSTFPLLLLFGGLGLFAQNERTNSSWTVKKPFFSEVFIENKGQFDNQDNHPEKNVKYAINNMGMKVYFSPSGLSYHVINIAPAKTLKEEEREELMEEMERSAGKNKKADMHLKEYFTDKSAFVHVEFMGANPAARLTVSNQVHDTYAYYIKTEAGEGSSIIATAFKKLTYKNIYPNIDIEFYFPENAGTELGVKYNLVVHPGGDLSQVKMKYSGMQTISLDKSGNIVAAIPDGNITDHAPSFSYVNNSDNPIKANFILEGETVSFQVPKYDYSQQLIIDPFISIWSVSPGFTTTNDGYTIRIDYKQNAYVMGGGVSNGGTLPNYNYQVKKFNSSGSLQWTATGIAASNIGAYGDMIVLRSGKAIVGMGFGAGNTAYILNPLNGAITTKAVPLTTEFGWRLSYNLAVNNGILWAGGGSNNGLHLTKTDTNLTTATLYNPWAVVSGNSNTEDVCYLAQDPTGSFLYVTNSSNSDPSSSTTAPKMVKVDPGNPGTWLWKVKEPSSMMEAGQSSFINGGIPAYARGWSTGVNGMEVTNSGTYTYNGSIIRKYDPANGSIVAAVSTGGIFDKHSGMDADSCSRIYIGDKNMVKRYSSTLNLETIIPTSGDVYDLQLDPLSDKRLYVTGKGFVQLIDISKCNGANLTATGSTETICASSGGCATISANANGGIFPYTYSWNSGNTSQSIVVCPSSTTVYTVTVTDAAGNDVMAVGTASFTIPFASITGDASICAGKSSTLTASAGTNYSWSTGETTSSIVVSPTTATNYSVTLDIGGCQTYSSYTVSAGKGVVYISSPSTICPGSSVTLSAAATGTYSWSTGAISSSIIVSPSYTTIYTTTVTNGGCSSVGTVKVTVDPVIQASINPSATTICSGNSVTLSATGGDTYLWNTGETTFSIVVSPTATTSYCVDVFSSMNCSKNACATVTMCLTGIQNYVDVGFIWVYPNPSAGLFTISSEKEKINSLEVFNMVGEKVTWLQNSKSNQAGYRTTLDLSSQANGIYFLKIKTDAGSVVKKLNVIK